MNIKLGHVLAATGILALCVAGRSSAGERDADSLEYVKIDRTSLMATGQISAARNSPDKNQYIGCWINAYSSGRATEAYCRAHDAAATGSAGEVLCISTAPQFIQAVSAVNSDSILEFDWDATGRCTYLYTETASYVSPKT
ncbi:MAG TPA: hypothetical protein VGI39_18220 [Polyangiaceae bacterium]|jgi:hypothetical protein